MSKIDSEEKILFIAIRREVDQAISDIGLGNLDDAKRILTNIMKQGMVDFMLERSEASKINDKRKKQLIIYIEAELMKIEKEAKMALKELEKGDTNAALKFLNQVKEEVSKALLLELKSERIR